MKIEWNGKEYWDFDDQEMIVDLGFLWLPLTVNSKTKWLCKPKVKFVAAVDLPLYCSIPPFFPKWIPKEFA